MSCENQASTHIKLDVHGRLVFSNAIRIMPQTHKLIKSISAIILVFQCISNSYSYLFICDHLHKSEIIIIEYPTLPPHYTDSQVLLSHLLL